MVYPPCAVTLPVSVCRTAALALLIKAAAVLISLLSAPYGRPLHRTVLEADRRAGVDAPSP